MPVSATSQQEFSDADFRIVDNGDQSKKLAFELSGIATGTTRTWTVPDANVTISSFAATFLDDTTAAAAATTLGLGTGNSPQFTAIELGNASDTTLSRLGAASVGIEGVAVIKATGSASIALTSQISTGTFSGTGATRGTIVDTTTISHSGTGTGTEFVGAFYNANGLVGTITTAASATAYNTSSDQDLKNDDGPIDPALAMSVLRLIRIHNFRWKNTDEAAVGVFAQELHKVYPAAVTVGGWVERERWDELKDEKTGETKRSWQGRVTKNVKGKEVIVSAGVLLPDMGVVTHREYMPWSVDYSKLMPVVIAAMQNIDQRLSALEAA